ncbi:hypothetical protein, partial [Clavibacter michiganensis]|uniref:hypothetical protein n=1 Tax=Clavibacter michiganensis TaxID=28447 RepID=UPI00292CEC63
MPQFKQVGALQRTHLLELRHAAEDRGGGTGPPEGAVPDREGAVAGGLAGGGAGEARRRSVPSPGALACVFGWRLR